MRIEIVAMVEFIGLNLTDGKLLSRYISGLGAEIHNE